MENVADMEQRYAELEKLLEVKDQEMEERLSSSARCLISMMALKGD